MKKRNLKKIIKPLQEENEFYTDQYIKLSNENTNLKQKNKELMK